MEAAEKRRATEETHKDFVLQMKHAFMAGEGLGLGFSQIIKERFPESSEPEKRTGGSK